MVVDVSKEHYRVPLQTSLVSQSRILSALRARTHVGHVLIRSKSFVQHWKPLYYNNLRTKQLPLYHLVK